MCRPSLQSVPDLHVLDWPPVSKYDASSVWFLHPVTLTFSSETTTLTCALVTVSEQPANYKMQSYKST